MHDVADTHRLPPQDLTAERCALASLMLAGTDRTLFAQTRAPLTADCWMIEDHALIFQTICRRADQQKPIDAVLILEELKLSDKLREIGGSAYLADILQSVPSAGHGPHYAGIVAKKASLRRLIALADYVIRKTHEFDADPSEIYQHAIDRAASEHTTGVTAEAILLEDALHEVYEEATGDGIPMLPMPFTFMNEWLGGGVAGGEFIIVAGWPSHGKSALLKQIAANFTKHGFPGGIVSLEEGRRKIARDMLASASGISNKDIRRGKLGGKQADMLAEGIAMLAGRKFYIHESAQTLAQVTTAIDIGVVKQGWKWAMVDHLDLVDTGKMDTEENETGKHNAMSRTIKHLAKRLNIPIFAVKQLKKRGTAIRKPSPDDLRASGAYHADADVVLFSDSDDVHHREDTGWQTTGMTSIIGSKVRAGTGGIRQVKWHGATQSLVEIESRESFANSPPINDDPWSNNA